MIIFSMDLSLNSPGFAVIEVDKKKAKLLEKCFVDNEKDPEVLKDKKTATARKLQNTARIIQHLLKKYEPDYVVRERGFSFHNATTQALFRVVGIADLIVYDTFKKGVIEITPKQVKKFITGYGNASKEDVSRCLEKYVGYLLYETPDESDAVAVGLSLAIQLGEIDMIEVIDITIKKPERKKVGKPKVGRPKKKKSKIVDEGKDVVIINDGRKRNGKNRSPVQNKRSPSESKCRKAPSKCKMGRPVWK